MNLDEDSIVAYIIENYQTNYFYTIDFLKDNKKSLNKEILKVEKLFDLNYNVQYQ